MNVVLTMSLVMQLLCRMALNTYVYIQGRIDKASIACQTDLATKIQYVISEEQGCFSTEGAVFTACDSSPTRHVC